jgi:cell division protein FtsN
MNSMFNPSFLLTFVFNNTGRRFTYAVYTFVLVLVVCSMPQSLFGQTQANIPPAESYFHQGAQQFIYNNLEAAISAVETGLERYPDDLKLQSLYEQLKEQQQQNQDSQNEQDDGDQNEENSEQNSEQQMNEENSEQNSESEERESENDDQSQSQDEQAPNDSDPRERTEAEELKDLSKEEAQKILQALAQKEKELLKEFKKAKTKGGKTHEKDW